MSAPNIISRSFKLPATLYARLKALAALKQITVSEVAIAAIEQYLKGAK
jgi:predicted DNA-binding protein